LIVAKVRVGTKDTSLLERAVFVSPPSSISSSG